MYLPGTYLYSLSLSLFLSLLAKEVVGRSNCQLLKPTSSKTIKSHVLKTLNFIHPKFHPNVSSKCFIPFHPKFSSNSQFITFFILLLLVGRLFYCYNTTLCTSFIIIIIILIHSFVCSVSLVCN